MHKNSIQKSSIRSKKGSIYRTFRFTVRFDMHSYWWPLLTIVQFRGGEGKNFQFARHSHLNLWLQVSKNWKRIALTFEFDSRPQCCSIASPTFFLSCCHQGSTRKKWHNHTASPKSCAHCYYIQEIHYNFIFIYILFYFLLFYLLLLH